MNERQHITLTEAQIIAAEKGELQLEYRNGEKVCQVIWLKTPYTQTYNPVMSMTVYGNIFNHSLSGKCSNHSSYDLFVLEPDVDFSEPTELPNDFMKVGEHITIEGAEFVVCEDVNNTTSCDECDLSLRKCGELNLKCCETILKIVDSSTEQSPKPLYEFGEIIEMSIGDDVWVDVEVIAVSRGVVFGWSPNNPINSFGRNHRKKQTEKTVTLENKVMTVKEAFKFLTNL